MMHGRGKSDFAIVAVKLANKAERSAAESVERRAETKGNVDQQRTHRTQRRISVAIALTWCGLTSHGRRSPNSLFMSLAAIPFNLTESGD